MTLWAYARFFGFPTSGVAVSAFVPHTKVRAGISLHVALDRTHLLVSSTDQREEREARRLPKDQKVVTDDYLTAELGAP